MLLRLAQARIVSDRRPVLLVPAVPAAVPASIHISILTSVLYSPVLAPLPRGGVGGGRCKLNASPVGPFTPPPPPPLPPSPPPPPPLSSQEPEVWPDRNRSALPVSSLCGCGAGGAAPTKIRPSPTDHADRWCCSTCQGQIKSSQSRHGETFEPSDGFGKKQLDAFKNTYSARYTTWYGSTIVS